MSDVVVITNHQPRHVLYWYELSKKERREFDYLDTDIKQADGIFFRYRGNVYDLGEFMQVPLNSPLRGWQGYTNDTYFSGVCVTMHDDDSVIVGTFFAR